jgi:hypothetical protein
MGSRITPYKANWKKNMKLNSQIENLILKEKIKTKAPIKK